MNRLVPVAFFFALVGAACGATSAPSTSPSLAAPSSAATTASPVESASATPGESEPAPAEPSTPAAIPEADRAAIRTFIEAVGEQDFDAAAAVVAPGAAFMPGPGGGPTVSFPTADALAAWMATEPRFQCAREITGMTAAGDRILVEVEIGPSPPGCPVPPGTIIEMPFLVENGQVLGILPN